MKKILIVESDDVIDRDRIDSKRILLKKNKTIIKDLSYFSLEFYAYLNENSIPYKKMIEEWEVFNENKIQIICTPFGTKAKAIHIISNNKPTQGAKALFQSEKLTILSLMNGVVSIDTFIVDETDKIKSEPIYKNRYITYEDLLENIPQNFKAIIESIQKTQEAFPREGYSQPIWCI